MQFVEIKNEAGAVLEIPTDQISYVMKMPMERDYILGLRGAIMKVDGASTPFDTFKQKLIESETRFEVFPIPEGTDALINPDTLLFMTPVELTITALMYPGGKKVVVAEGVNTVRAKLTGKSLIQEG